MVHQAASLGKSHLAPTVNQGRRAQHPLLQSLQPRLRQAEGAQCLRGGHQLHREVTE